MGRLRQRVRNLCSVPGMPNMALVYVTAKGALKIVGHPMMAEAIQNSNIMSKLTSDAKRSIAPVKDTKSVNIRQVSLAINFEDVSDAHLLRQTLTQLVIDKGTKGSRSVWGNPDKKPSWWPAASPFVAPSATQTDGDGRNHRILTTTIIRKAIRSWQEDTIMKLKSGCPYTHAVDSREVLERIIGQSLDNTPDELESERNAEKDNTPDELESERNAEKDCCKLKITARKVRILRGSIP